MFQAKRITLAHKVNSASSLDLPMLFKETIMRLKLSGRELRCSN